MSSSSPTRWVAVVLGLLLVAAAVVGARGARFSDDPLAALPAADPEVRAFRSAAAPFGSLQTLLIGVERDDLFSQESLEQLRTFTRRAAAVRGVAEVVCFTETPLVRAGTATTELADLVPRPVPADPARLAEVRAQVLSNDLVVGQLVAADGRAALLPVVLDPSKRPMRETAREVAYVASRVLEGGRVVVDGAPGAALGLSTAQAAAAPLMALVILAALLLAPILVLRRAGAVVLALLATGAVTAAALLPAGLLGGALGPSAQVALIGVAGLALPVFCYVLLAGDPATARDRGTGPVLHGALASAAVGALALVLSGQEPAALLLLTGAFATLIAAALVLPGLAGTRPVPARPREIPEGRPFLAAVVTVACAALYLGVPRLHVAVEPGEAFREGSGPRVAEEFLRAHFGGQSMVLAALHGDLYHPEALDALRALESAALADPAVREATSVLGAVRTQGAAYGRPSELPPNAAGVRKFFFLAGGQPGLGQLVQPARGAAAMLVKVDPDADPEAVLRVRDSLRDAVPGALRYVQFADATPEVRERMTAELLDRLSQRLARLGIAADKRTPAFLRQMLDRVAASAGPDVAAIRVRIGEHFVDGTTYVLVRDLENNEPLAVGESEAGKLAEAVAGAGRIDAASVQAALAAVFPAAAADVQGLEAEARLLLGALERVASEGAGKTELPEFVKAWSSAETGAPEDALRAEAELIAASGELRSGGIALPAGDGVPYTLHVGGMPLAAASVRAATLRSLTTGFVVAALFGLVLWTLLFLAGEGGSTVPGTCSTGWSATLSGVSRAMPLTLVPLVGASFAFGGAGFLGLPADPGLPVTLGAVIAVGGTLGALLILPGMGARNATAWQDGRRTALHLGPALAAVGLALSLIPLPPARTLGLVLAVGFLASLVLGWVYSGRR